jgi:DNA-directed RNA polymerase specialized sigma24 family protein
MPMSPLQALAPDQRAILELLLRQGRSYGELSGMLGLPEDGVRTRAHAALAALAPDRPAPVGEDGAVADWLLGQQD